MVLLDTSANIRAMRGPGPARDLADRLTAAYLHATCALVDLELGHSSVSPRAAKLLAEDRRDLLVHLPITEIVTARALEVQAELGKAGLHRAAGPTDLLIAATAEVHGAALLHYDADFDYIASITGQRAEWIVPRGTVA
jgi:predicted nucleic acid-binding protein